MIFWKGSPDAGLAAAGKGVAGNVSGADRSSAVRAAGALQGEFAPALLWLVQSTVRGTRQRPLELAAVGRWVVVRFCRILASNHSTRRFPDRCTDTRLTAATKLLQIQRFLTPAKVAARLEPPAHQTDRSIHQEMIPMTNGAFAGCFGESSNAVFSRASASFACS